MRYINWADVTGRYRDAAKVADATDGANYWIVSAEGEVDARLASKYSVPFANTPTLAPDIVRDLSIDLAYFKMTVGKEGAKELKKYIDERFKGLLDGTISIVSSGGTVVDQAVSAWSNREGYHSSFGVDDPVNWHVSSQWEQATQDAREYGL